MRHTRAAMGAAASVALAVATLAPTLSTGPAEAAAPGPTGSVGKAFATPSDDITPPWRARYDDLRQRALEQRLRQGGDGPVEKVARGRYARVEHTGTDRIFVVLAEFGNTRHSDHPDDPSSGAQRFDGPRHDEIPEPDRADDNMTIWQKHYDRAHYEHLYFTRMRRYYEQQSNGVYSIRGQVTAWVKVPFNEARYGSSNCGRTQCGNGAWYLVRDALAAWVQGRLDAGWTMDRVQRFLSTFDRQDRYDFDHDGNFDEPDGYIDHFQVVHAGGDEADGDPVYGTDAIWSHRSNVGIHPEGTGPGPAVGGIEVGEGGVEDPAGAAVAIPDNPTGIWVSDYTMQAENGGLGVFAHEYAHDLDLPDEYDRAGNTGGSRNSVGFWSLMAQSRGSLPGDEGVGEQAQPLGAWDKFQLGWLDYDVARAGRPGTYRIRPGQVASGSRPNGLVVLLPDKLVTIEHGEPCGECGERFYFSGSGNDLDNTMSRTVAGGGELTAQVRYDIEPGWDFAFLEASPDGGKTWAAVDTSRSYDGADESGANPSGAGISGTSSGWVDLTATIPEGTDAIRFRYRTDGNTAPPGFQVDNVTLAGQGLGDAEADGDDWSLDGFTVVGTESVEHYLNAYFVDNRQYVGRDRALRYVYQHAGRWNRPRWVNHYRYQPGALISYWDTSYTDNDVGAHPGGGLILPVDAHPDFQHAWDGSILPTTLLSSDSTFSTRRVRPQELHYDAGPLRLDGEPAQPVFDDTLDWWFDGDEHGSGEHTGTDQPGWFGVDVPKTGTTIRVVKVDRRGVMTVRVGRS